MMLQRMHLAEVQWLMFCLAFILSCIGIAFVYSATMDPADPYTWGLQAKKQLVWFIISIIAAMVLMHVPTKQWKENAVLLYVACLFLQLGMWAAAGTALVPIINGAHNWISLGPVSLQPSEFFKIAVLISCAALGVSGRFEIQRFSHVFIFLSLAGFPAMLLAKEDLGSALTFLPMALGMLVLGGMRIRHFLVIMLILASIIWAGVSYLASNASDTYQWRRIDAWMHPDKYRQEEAFQTTRAMRSIGSGQWVGKGFGEGDQNLLDWLPEKRTDMIFAVVGEEIGFIGSSIVIGLFLLFGWAGLYTAMHCHDKFARFFIVGFTCLLMGQMSINISVALGLIPVTGITLPFFSYGGSSLLAMFCGLGICLAASATRANEFSKDVL
jgi:rod shape determining protein RodA